MDAQFCLIAFNATAAAGFRQVYGKDMVVGMPLRDMVPEHERPYWEGLYRRVLTGERFTEIYETAVEGNQLYLELFLNPIVADDTITGIAVYALALGLTFLLPEPPADLPE